MLRMAEIIFAQSAAILITFGCKQTQENLFAVYKESEEQYNDNPNSDMVSDIVGMGHMGHYIVDNLYMGQ